VPADPLATGPTRLSWSAIRVTVARPGGRRDPVFLEAAHADAEWREDPTWPGSATYRGVERVRQVILDRMDTLDFEQQTEDLIDIADKVVVLVRWVGRGKTSGAQGEITMAMVWTVRDQAITRVEFFLDRAQAFEAVGLRE
jgi:ketosteroid isomerase-like protein